jgi:BlaI family penicillinase repressor
MQFPQEKPMTEPERGLAPAQYEIMQVVWDHGATGATVFEIWTTIGQKREVTRTTILNQVDRLEKRGWLSRHQQGGVYRYVATVDQVAASQRLAGEFVDDFFGGSAKSLVASLLGDKRLKKSEVEKLRRMLDEAAGKRRQGDES